MLQDMYRLNRPKPDIVFRRSGQIDIRLEASRRMCLTPGSRVSFFLDGEGDLYVRRDADGAARLTFDWSESYLSPLTLCLAALRSLDDKGDLPARLRLRKVAQIFDDGARFPQA